MTHDATFTKQYASGSIKRAYLDELMGWGAVGEGALFGGLAINNYPDNLF